MSKTPENLSYVLNYTPTPKQRLFHASDADEVLFGGAAGGGKSKAIVMDALFRCLKYPATHAYIFRRTYGELEDTVIILLAKCRGCKIQREHEVSYGI